MHHPSNCPAPAHRNAAGTHSVHAIRARVTEKVSDLEAGDGGRARNGFFRRAGRALGRLRPGFITGVPTTIRARSPLTMSTAIGLVVSHGTGSRPYLESDRTM